MKVRMENDLREITKGMRRLANKHVQRATRSGINRGLLSGRTELSKAIREKKRVKAAAIKARVSLNKARLQSLSGDLSLTSRRLGLDNFRARQTRRGVTVRMNKGGSTRVDGAFIIQGGGGKKIIVARGRYPGTGQFKRTATRLPITRLQTFSITNVADKTNIRERVAQRMREQFAKRFEQQLNRHRNK